MTMPTLIQNHQKRSLEVATKKFYSMMSQAVRQYMADEGVDDLRNTALASDNYEDISSPESIESIRNFVTKYLKVAKECYHDANDCFASDYKVWDGSQNIDFIQSTSNMTSFKDYVLADGSIIKIGFYSDNYPISLYVDVNGKKGPNKIGYDFWTMSIFYDGSIDESEVTPERKKNEKVYSACCNEDSTPSECRALRFEKSCQKGSYGGCFGHFLENGFKFDY